MGVARPLTVAILIPRYSQLFGPVAAAAVLVAFWVGMLASLRDKCQVLDEPAYVVGGYAFWRYNDYRLNPENGNLPQRVIALPLLFGNYRFPGADSNLWRTSLKWSLAWQWLYELGNNAAAMIQRGRAASGLLAVVLGVLVWRWSRELFGPKGGMLSLLLYVLNPTILANGALMTADAASGLFFLAATWSWWRMLQRLTTARVLTSALATGGLFVSKMSAPLIVAIALALLVARLVRGGPLPVHLFGQRELRTRNAQLLALSCAAVVNIILVLVVVWGFHGLRYSAFSPSLPNGTWQDPWAQVLEKPVPSAVFERLDLPPAQLEQVKQVFTREEAEQDAWSLASLKAVEAVKREVLTEPQAVHLDQLLSTPPPHLFPRVLETLRHYRLLPEAYIYGYAHVWHNSRGRAAFLNGNFSMTGWRIFFPYTFLVKTPLTVFAVIGLAIAAVIARWRVHRRTPGARGLFLAFYDALPLWALFGFYWAAAISSHLNIGHRHIFPTYPPLFVLCGAAASWWGVSQPGGEKLGAPNHRWMRAARTGLSILIILLAIEVCYRFPNYLAYFNGIVRPANAYRHLVDSSLDWGQDLPGVRRYIETRHPADPCYLSYFGYASAVYYRVPAIYTYSVTGRYRSPALQTLIFPAEQADELLYDFLRREPEYDDQMVGRAKVGDKVSVALVKKPAALRLTGGTYFISATLLQSVTQPKFGAFGPWNERLERNYQSACRLVAPLLSNDPAERRSALGQFPPEKWINLINTYEHFRFYRLAAFLRHREPDDNVGFSILVYRISDEDLTRALDGPPAELGRDILQELFAPPR